MNQRVVSIRPSALLLIAIVIICLCTISIFMYIQSLSAQISDLKQSTYELKRQIEQYEDSRCRTATHRTYNEEVQRYRLQSAGYERSYQVQVPHHYDPDIRYPVILSFDGMEGSGDRMRGYADLQSLPAIVVYPDSLEGSRGFTAWQGAPYAINNNRDIQFVRDILFDLPERYCIDGSKQFAVGMSNGGGFATLVSCELSDQIRAVVSVSGAYYTDCVGEGKRTPSLMVVHSKTDKQVPFMGAESRKLPDVPHWVEHKAKVRGCQDKTQRIAADGTEYYSWFDCKNGSLLRFVALNNQDHGWLRIPSGHTKDLYTAETLWNFFNETVY